MSIPDQFITIYKEWAQLFAHRSMDDMKRFMDDAGLSATQTNTLMRIYHRGTCGVSDIGDHAGITSAAASQMIERLVQQGYIDRSEAPEDRRAKRIYLTEKGETLVKKAIEARHAWLERVINTLSSEEKDVVAAALRVLTDAARKLEAEDQ